MGLKETWLTQSVGRGQLLQKVGTPKCWVIAGTSQFGAIGVRLFPMCEKATAGSCFDWFSLVPLPGEHDEGDEGRIAYLRILDPRAWRCADIEAATEKSFAHLPPDRKVHSVGLVLKPTNARCVLEHVAMRAFRGISASRLPWLADFLGIKFAAGKRPRSEPLMVMTLLEKIFPDMSAEDRQEIVGLGSAYPDGIDTDDEADLGVGLLKRADMKACLKGVGAQEDDDEIEQIKDKHQQKLMKRAMWEKRKEQEQNRRPRRPAGASASSGSAAPAQPGNAAERAPKGLSFTVPADLSEETLSMYLPGVAGCRLRLESHWHTRWHIAYLASAPPFTTSRVFGTLEEVWPAARHCILWAWKRHTDDGGQACPWDFWVRVSLAPREGASVVLQRVHRGAHASDLASESLLGPPALLIAHTSFPAGALVEVPLLRPCAPRSPHSVRSRPLLRQRAPGCFAWRPRTATIRLCCAECRQMSQFRYFSGKAALEYSASLVTPFVCLACSLSVGLGFRLARLLVALDS